MKALDIEDILSINEIADLREQYEKDLSKIQEHDSLKKWKISYYHYPATYLKVNIYEKKYS